MWFVNQEGLTAEGSAIPGYLAGIGGVDTLAPLFDEHGRQPGKASRGVLHVQDRLDANLLRRRRSGGSTDRLTLFATSRDIRNRSSIEPFHGNAARENAPL